MTDNESSGPSPLLGLLSNLNSSLEATSTSLPTAPFPKTSSGISLLSLKNHALLSYLHHLVFFILIKLRNKSLNDDDDRLGQDVRDKLIELRVILERGVKPMEGRLSYMIQKVVRAADRLEATGLADGDVKDIASAAGALAFKPNPSALVSGKDEEGAAAAERSDGIYRPPKISSTALPASLDPTRAERRQRASAMQNATMRNFISEELTDAPVAEPSIGSTITSHKGRIMAVSDRDRNEDRRRMNYEEENYTRLPAMSKKEMSKRKGRSQEIGFGGEDWGVLDRSVYDRTVKSSKDNVVERSRKRRGNEGADQEGPAAGERFEKRRKVLAGRKGGRGGRS
ncbi:hypothetical protein YB2330_003543 [Saitoella coloradoensis]